MEDKYQFLRQDLPKLVAEAARHGATNPRAQLIIELLAERDQLAADAEDRNKKSFNGLPLCMSPLNVEERARLDENLKSLLRFLGSPGGWGYETKLGRLAVVLDDVRRELWFPVTREV